MSITDELRKWIDSIAWLDNSVSQAHKSILSIADRIDVEYAAYRAAVSAIPKECVKLPVDADGVPIRVGDRMAFEDGEEFEVKGFGGSRAERLFYLNENGRFCWGIAENCRHVKPDSWERIIADAANYEHDGWQGSFRDFVDGMVERCKRLAGR